MHSACETRHVLNHALAAIKGSGGVWLATVAATYGSSPRPVGSLWAWSPDYGMAGSLSGGCIEEDLIHRLRAGKVPGPFPQRLRFGANADEQARYKLPCGGHLDIVLERLGSADAPQLQRMLGWLEERAGFTRRVFTDGTALSRVPAATENTQASKPDANHCLLQHEYRPQWQLLLVGAGEVARQLALLAQPAGFAVTVCDHRDDYLQGFAASGADIVPGLPDALIRERFYDRHSAVVALAHDPRLDDIAMLEALETEAYYIGAMGALSTSASRRARLHELGVTPQALARLHAPVGLDIGSKTPYEIAVSVLAHLLAERRVV
ncbi:XdhC family protein [Thalassolituus sp. LLYu03]|uniref:XdhC family protein n=1 Tax=Thalassolituus sp. LLYu03 TaxID=3421656 RepID=UPI003D286AA7